MQFFNPYLQIIWKEVWNIVIRYVKNLWRCLLQRWKNCCHLFLNANKPYLVYLKILLLILSIPLVLLSSDKWTPLLNKKFVSCALDRLFEKACTSSVRILLTRDSRYYTSEHRPRIALLELCIVAIESNKHTYKLIDKGKQYDTILLTTK